MKYTLQIIFLLTILLLSLTGCSSEQITIPGAELIISAARYNRNPKVSEDDLTTLVTANNDFAIDLFKELAKESENVFFSPYSLSQALSMTWEGANGETKSQMTDAMHYTNLDQAKVHEGFNKLNLKFLKEKAVNLENSNAVWAQKDYSWKSEYLDSLKVNYNSGIYETDFVKDPSSSINAINKWIEMKSKGKFKSMLSKNNISSATRMALLNAIYLHGKWEHPFDQSKTKPAPFTLLDETSVDVNTMVGKKMGVFMYFKDEDFQAVEMPYKKSDISMLVLVPNKVYSADPEEEPESLAVVYERFEESLNADKLSAIVSKLQKGQFKLIFPKTELTAEMDLKNPLKALGIEDAFSPGADFARMASTDELFITDILQKAYLLNDEEGTKAIAVTNIDIAGGSFPAVVVNSPFIFFIRDTKTNTIIFMGRILDPSKLKV